MNVLNNLQRIRSGAKTSVAQWRNIGSLAATAVVAWSLSFGVYAQAGTKEDLPKLSASNSQMIARETEPELQRFVDQQKRLPQQAKQVLVQVTPDPSAGIIWIDLDASYLPKDTPYFTEDLGQLVREVENEGYELLSGIVKFRYIKVRIGGKELREIYPPEYLKKRKARQAAKAVAPPVEGLVVLNPGHGKYLHHADNTWRYQRPDPYAGTTDVYEDTVTPGYSSMLASLLNQRSANTATSIKHTRDIGNNSIDPESNLAWAALGARYYLKRLYPNLGSTIWNKYPNGTEPARLNLREYDEDIRARPEYANYINAETLISLHTDGADPAARGATVIANLEDAASNQLATNIHCYLTEQITQLPDYANYVIRPGVRAGDNYGEVREAAMPTTLVEIGFHTNAEDSAALRNSVFRTAAMKGVEKGYRLNAAGKTTCEPFKISSIPNVTGPYRVSMPVLVSYVGYPQFPVKIKVDYVTCPYPWTCKGFEKSVVTEVPSPLSYTVICNANPRPPATFKIKTTLTDADGVKTNTMEHSYTCATPAAAKQVIDTLPAGRPTTGAGTG